MNSLKNILFPTDFSKNSKNALAFAIDIVKRNKGCLSLLNVGSPPTATPYNLLIEKDELKKNTEESIKRLSLAKLNQLLEEDKSTSISYTVIHKEGVVSDEIINASQNGNVDLIVMGTKGESSEEGLFMGSITKGLINHTYCPVLAIPEKASFNKLSKIVYATSLENRETNVINYLVRFASLYNAKIILLHVDLTNSSVMASENELKKIIDASKYKKIEYQLMRASNVAEGIAEFMGQERPSLLAVTTHTTNLFNRLVHKSISKQLLLHTHIPLLALNRKKYDTVFLG